jgi:Zn-dependent protease
MQLVQAVFQFVILLFSVSCHECAHAWMASRLGDYTARLEGRISLNPIRHIDLMGTLLFPLLMVFGPFIGFGGPGIVFGWGKPTPVLTRNLKKITRDDNIISLAGPAANLILVAVGFLLLVILILAVPGGREAVAGAEMTPGAASAPEALALLGWLTIEVNLALIIFNFIPILPLDAGRIVRNMLPYNALNTFDTLGRFGFVIIFILGSILIRICLGPAMRVVIAALSIFLPGQ